MEDQQLPRPFIPNPEFERLILELANTLCQCKRIGPTACPDHIREARGLLYEQYEQQSQAYLKRIEEDPSITTQEAARLDFSDQGFHHDWLDK